MKLAVKIFFLLVLAFASVAILASPDQPLKDLDRELFTGAGIGLIILVWMVILWLFFRRGREDGPTSEPEPK